MKFRNLKAYFVFSLLAAIITAAITVAGTRVVGNGVIAFLITFIVMLVVIATLDLSVKREPQDPNKPRLS